MRVLQICHKMPFPPNDGGTLAMYQLSKAMIEMGWDVKLLGISTAKHPFVEYPLDEVFIRTKPESVEINTTPKSVELVKGIWKKNNYIVSRFFDLSFVSLIKDSLKSEKYDLVIFEGAFTAVYIDEVKKYFKGTTMLRSHNVEFHLWEERLENEFNFLKRWILQQSVNQLKDFELSELKKVDVVAAISMTDKAFFNSHFGLNKTIYLPFGISLPEQLPIDDEVKNKIVYIGALDWEPNTQGLYWFLSEVWPLILNKNKKLEFHIAGRKAPVNFEKKLPDGVTFHGEVDDAHEFIMAGELMVVPLLAGSGIRIKIIEGLALGQVVATTTKGAQGIPGQSGKDLLISDTPKLMAQQILEAFHHKGARASISKQSRILAEKEFDITNTQKSLLQVVKTFVR